MRILFLAHLFPLPLDSGGKIKSYYTLKTLAAVHEVHILAYVRTDEEMRLALELQKICDVTVIPLRRSKPRQFVDLANAFFSGKSFIVTRDFRDEMQRKLDELIDRFRPDVIHIDHLQMAQFVKFGGSYKTVLDHHNVESMIIKRIAETSESKPARLYARMEWPKLQRYELDICRKCDLVLTVSEEDKSTLLNLNSSLVNIESVPIGVDIHYFQPVERRSGSRNILSIGTMYWPPNVDSMLYFCRDIFPLVRNQIQNCTLTIAGQRPVESIQTLANDPAITVPGYIDDVREIARDCGAFIVPLRSGSGVRVKILNALAMGLPIVSTSIGVEGLDMESGTHLLIADNPEDFADAVVNVLSNASLADKLSRNGRALVCEKYSWEGVGERLLGLYGKYLA